MSETDKKVEEEYQFSNPDQVNFTFENEGKQKGKIYQILFQAKTKRIVIMSLASLVALLGVYNLFTRIISKPVEMQTNEQSEPVNTETIQSTLVASTTYHKVVQSNNLTDEDNNDNDNESRLSSLELTTQQKEDEINSMIINLSSIQRNLESFSSKLNDLNTQVDQLTHQVFQHQDQISELEKAKDQVNTNEEISYDIQAIIPGRAWLISSEGKVTTVREGSHLEEYGIVTAIDPNRGTIITSSGNIIEYSQEDS